MNDLNTQRGNITSASYRTRAEAVATATPDFIEVIWVGPLAYVRDDASTAPALTQSNGRKWVPADRGNVAIQHFGENTTPGVTDMAGALEAAFKWLSASTPWLAVNSRGPTRLSGLGEIVALSRTVVAGLIGTNSDNTYSSGSGPLYGIAVSDVRFKAIGGWAANFIPSNPDIGRPLIYCGDYRTYSTDTEDHQFRVARIHFDASCEFDCAFKSDGIYFENTGLCRIDSPVFNIRKNGVGIDTSIGYGPSNSRGFYTKNQELVVSGDRTDGNLRIDGNSDFPPGENIDTMAATGLRIRTNDFKIQFRDTTNCATAIDISGRAAQIVGIHPWSRKIVLRERADKITFTNCYFDYTTVEVRRPANADPQRFQFVACDWREGACNLDLIATKAGETGEGIQIVGAQFSGAGAIRYLTEGAGTWVADHAKRVGIIGNGLEINTGFFRAGAPGFAQLAGNGPYVELFDTDQVGDNRVRVAYNGGIARVSLWNDGGFVKTLISIDAATGVLYAGDVAPANRILTQGNP